MHLRYRYNISQWQSCRWRSDVSGTQCHPYHWIASGNWLKTASITEDFTQFLPDLSRCQPYQQFGSITRCQSYHQVGLTLGNRCHPYHRLVSIWAAMGNSMSHAYVIETWNADSCWPLLLLFRRINLDEEKVLLVSVYVYVSVSVFWVVFSSLQRKPLTSSSCSSQIRKLGLRCKNCSLDLEYSNVVTKTKISFFQLKQKWNWSNCLQ